MIFLPTPARAEATVTLRTPAPFDRWCVAPLCQGPSATPTPLVVPPLAGDDAIAGYAEEKLRAYVANEVSAWIDGHAADWNTKPIRDLARTAIAAVLHDQGTLETGQGLGAALLRVGLTLRLEQALAEDPQCAGAARRDAIYEGLAVTRALGILAFPESKREVLARCEGTALAVAAAVDGAILRALDPRSELPKLVAQLEALRGRIAQIREAARALTPEDPASASRTFAALAKLQAAPSIAALLEVARAAETEANVLDTWTDGASATFAASIRTLLTVDLAPLRAPFAQALADVDAAALLQQAQTDPLACASEACTATKRLIAIARKGIDAEALRALVSEIRARLGLKTGDGIFARLVDAFDAAVVAGTAAQGTASATIDGKVFVRKVLSDYCVDEDGSFSLTCAIAGKPEPLVLEANAGVPRLSAGDVRAVGDLAIGWKTKGFGVVGRGYVNYFDLATATGTTDNLRTGGSLEAWYRTGGDDAKVRFEIRFVGGGDYYDTSYVPVTQGPANGWFHDEDSTLLRATLLAGLVLEPSSRLFLDVLVGGGGQYESYGYLATDPRDPNVLSDTTSVSARGSGRLLARWSFWPGFLALRIRSEGSVFRLTRDVFSVAQIGRPMSATTTTTEVTQIETFHRAFVDLDVAKFFGFVPAIFGGVDAIRISGDAGSTNVVVPLVGIGIVRPAF
jgi:hypothetical protein